ncbi:MAG: thioredoxin family protein [bacterium]|nr:thioredoxin family protein [bacterium]
MPVQSLTDVPQKAPPFSLPNVDGRTVSLSDFQGKILAVIFTCNHCPYAKASWPELIKLANEYMPKGIDFVAINPNDEVVHPEDSFEVMKERAKEWNIPFPYLRDGSQDVARAYSAQCTPDVFVYDEDRTLQYHGRVNSDWQHPESAETELKNALDALLEDRSVSVQHPSMGCSIKWRNS